MNERDRLTQLRALRARIERLPQSAERDRMLGEIGRRTVDVECSAPATPVRRTAVEAELTPATPVRRPAMEAEVAPRRTLATARRRRTRADTAPGRARPTAAPASVRPTPSLPDGLRLSLADDDAGAPEATGRHRPTPPWARGLRG